MIEATTSRRADLSAELGPGRDGDAWVGPLTFVALFRSQGSYANLFRAATRGHSTILLRGSPSPIKRSLWWWPSVSARCGHRAGARITRGSMRKRQGDEGEILLPPPCASFMPRTLEKENEREEKGVGEGRLSPGDKVDNARLQNRSLLPVCVPPAASVSAFVYFATNCIVNLLDVSASAAPSRRDRMKMSV